MKRKKICGVGIDGQFCQKLFENQSQRVQLGHYYLFGCISDARMKLNLRW